MLPTKKPRGREAYKRVKCYIGMPEEYKDKAIVIKEALLPEHSFTKHITLGELSRAIGFKGYKQ